MDRKYCDLCKVNVKELDRTYFIDCKENTNFIGRFSRPRGLSKNEVCQDCVRKIEDFIGELTK